MLSRTAIVKLKAVLIIDIIIIGAAAGTYLYLQNQGVIASTPGSAKFTLTDLTIEPQQVYAGNGVQISVNLTDVGDLGGNKTVNFEINNAVKDIENETIPGNSSEIVQYTDVETVAGNYTVEVGSLTGNFTVNPAPPETSSIVLSNLQVNPYEVWANQTVTLTAAAQNPTTAADTMTVNVALDDKVVQTQIISVNASTTETIQFTVNATTQGMHTVTLNTLSGEFSVVETGYHTLEIARSGGGSKPLSFTLNGAPYGTPYIELLPVGKYTISCPNPFNVGTGVLAFTSWSDGKLAQQ